MEKKKIIKYLVVISSFLLVFGACKQTTKENISDSPIYVPQETENLIIQEIVTGEIDEITAEDMTNVEQKLENENNIEVNEGPQFIDGLVNYKGRLCYFRDGKVDVAYTGLAEYEKQTWYVSGGLVDMEYSGVVTYTGKEFVVEKGVVVKPKESNNVTDVVEGYKGRGEQVAVDYVGLASYKGRLCYFKDGAVDVTYTGLVKYENTMWYVSGGLVDQEYSGILESEGKQWYIENGLVIDEYSGILQENGTLYVYREGLWDEQFSGIIEHEGNSWYANAGILDKKFCGLVLVNNVLQEVNNGELVGLFSGVGTWEEETAYYVNGVIDTSFSGIADGQDAKWYVVNGMVAKDYSGIYCDENLENSIVINGKVSSSFTKDDLIRTYYTEREAIWLQMKYVMLQTLGSMEYIHFDDNVESVDIVGTVIDGMGLNSVASESLKQAIQSAASGESIDDIVNSAIEGTIVGGKSYVEEALKENISAYFLGFDIFKTIGKLNQMNDLFNPDDTPVVMANALVDDQERDIEDLLELIGDEVVDTEKIYQMVSLFQRILEREEMLADVLDKTNIMVSENIIKSLRIMEQSYGIWNQCIIEASNREWNVSIQLGTGDLKTSIELLGAQMQEDQALYDFAFEPLATEYDTKGFAYETAVGNSTSTFLGMTAGSLWGQLMKSDQQHLIMAVQEGHRDYYRKLCSYQEQSFEKLLDAKAKFDKVYGYYSLLEKDDSGETLLKYYSSVENVGENVPWEEERKQLLNCIAVYKFDMKCINDFYQCILSDGNQDYLNELSAYTSNLETLLEGREDVTSENDEQIYLAREKDYVTFMMQCLEWRNVPMFDEISQYTVYGVGYRTLYKSRDLITIVSQSPTLTNRDRIIRMYNSNGFPTYVRTPECEVFYRDGQLMEYSCNEGHAKSLYDNAVTVLEECKAH